MKLLAKIGFWLLLVAAPLQAEELQLYFVHNDHLGTPVVVTDSTQTVVWQAEKTPFGETTETVNSIEQPLRFPGQYFDKETGLHYNYFRDYDPGLGRYVQSDPIGLAGGINTYGYVGGNPVNYIDPYGLSASCVGNPVQCAAAGGVGSSRAGSAGRALSRAAAQESTKECDEDECPALESDVKAKAMELRRQYYRGLADPNDLYNKAYSSPNLGKRKGTWLGHREKYENAKRGLSKSIDRAKSKGCRVDSWDEQLLSSSYPSSPAAR